MLFNPGFDIQPTINPMGFRYGAGVFGPEVEIRSLDSIRVSLRNPDCNGPEKVYSIAMDVGKQEHFETLKKLHLLFGVVTYEAGRLGDEPVRSQGHIHNVSQLSGWSTSEVYEIWSGKAIIYMQETAKDHPGRCIAVEADPGQIVVVPPNWAHSAISVDPDQPLTFGAWCDRSYGFEYDDIRTHKGLAWFPVLDNAGIINWHKNQNYFDSQLIVKRPEEYIPLDIVKGKPIYNQFEEDNERFNFVPFPLLKENVWEGFIP